MWNNLTIASRLKVFQLPCQRHRNNGFEEQKGMYKGKPILRTKSNFNDANVSCSFKQN